MTKELAPALVRETIRLTAFVCNEHKQVYLDSFESAPPPCVSIPKEMHIASNSPCSMDGCEKGVRYWVEITMPCIVGDDDA